MVVRWCYHSVLHCGYIEVLVNSIILGYGMATGRYHWSNCAYPARFFTINAAASIPWLGVILHPSWMTFYVALVATTILLYVENVKKMTFTAFMRAINIWLTGRVKSTKSLVKEFAK